MTISHCTLICMSVGDGIVAIELSKNSTLAYWEMMFRSQLSIYTINLLLRGKTHPKSHFVLLKGLSPVVNYVITL